MGTSRSAFSLVELLVAVAVVGVLAILGTGLVTGTIQKSKITNCLNNLRQIGIAAQMYAADNNGRLPQSAHEGDSWAYVTLVYLGTSKCNRSPLDPNKFRSYSYNINDYLLADPNGTGNPSSGPGFHLVQKIPSPSETLFLALSQTNNLSSDHFHFYQSGYGATKFTKQVWYDIGDGASQYLFVDGHAERRKWSSVQNELARKGSRFIRPDGHP